MKRDLTEVIVQTIAVIVGIIPVVFLFQTSPTQISTQALIILGIIVGVILAIFIFNSVYNKYNRFKRQIEENKRSLDEIKRDLNFKNSINEMEVRMQVVETLLKTKRKGQIDPRIIMVVILIILLFLFLRVMKII